MGYPTSNTKPTVLPKEPRGEDSEEIIWTSVGRALSAWEELQGSLVSLFAVTLGCNHNWALHRAFGYNMVVTSKLDMLEYAAETLLHRNRELHTKFREFVNRVRAFNDRRNDIAHGSVWNFEDEKEVKHGYYLMPHSLTSKKYKETGAKTFPPPSYCWVAAQIDRYSEAFIALRWESFELREQINDFHKAVGPPVSLLR